MPRYRDALIARHVCRMATRRHATGYQILGRGGWVPCPSFTTSPGTIDAIAESVRYMGDGSWLTVTIRPDGRYRARFGAHRAAVARTETAAICLAAIRARRR